MSEKIATITVFVSMSFVFGLIIGVNPLLCIGATLGVTAIYGTLND